MNAACGVAQDLLNEKEVASEKVDTAHPLYFHTQYKAQPMPSVIAIRLFSAIAICLLLTSCEFLSEDEDQVEVVHYQGSPIDWERVPEWSASSDHGIISLNLAFRSMEDFRERYGEKDIAHLGSGEQFTLTLQDTSEELPYFVSFTRSLVPGYKGTYNSVNMGQMVDGTIFIESWNPNGIIRGRVEGKLALSDLEVFFYADMTDTSKEGLR